MTNVVFVDQVGRTIFAEEVERDLRVLKVKNPVMLNATQTQDGKLQLQLFPLFLAEFVDPSTRDLGTEWDYNRDQITICTNVKVDFRLIKQYGQVFGVNVPEPVQEVKTIKLFDE